MQATLTTVALPDFGHPEEAPLLPVTVYQDRLVRLRQAMHEAKLDAVVIYADREHQANLTWACGYDPRFEEAILIVGAAGQPTLLVGNEGWGYADLAPLPLRKVLFQSLSLLGQSRQESLPLPTLLREAGLHPGQKVGLAGWKYFSPSEFPQPDQQFETPAYLVEALRALLGEPDRLVNAGALFMDPQQGLRIINEVEQLAAFEFAACHTSNGLKQVWQGLRVGMTEYAAARLMGISGLPLSCHPMLSNGPRAAYGLPSPSGNPIALGAPFTMALGMWGALNARAGWVAASAADLPPAANDYLERLAKPYFLAIAAWYDTVGIGVSGATLYAVIQEHLGDPFFGVALNPGHYIHLDEWVHSPVYAHSPITLRSGMALQVDVIPATGTIYHTANMEDGIALADEPLRAALAAQYPAAWARIQARRTFMAKEIGIALKPEILPFSNIPAYFPPFVLRHQEVLVRRP